MFSPGLRKGAELRTWLSLCPQPGLTQAGERESPTVTCQEWGSHSLIQSFLKHIAVLPLKLWFLNNRWNILWVYLKRSHKRTAILGQAGSPEDTDHSGWSPVLVLGPQLQGCWLATGRKSEDLQEHSEDSVATGFQGLTLSDSRRTTSEEWVCCS